ncbi:MAG TPA: efflux RND transporter periplasmic adaptor subunit [Gammaproteobacteria bacterium]|nr:efflux RND transporter periplasmic adaptor subunit [Gammaproteobacteria bacterium]
MNKKTKVLFIIGMVVAILVVLVAWRVISNARIANAKHELPALTVDTAVAVLKPMPIQLTVIGQVQSEHTVAVQPQISGVLKQVFFREGEYVHPGQPLFLIDPAPYEAALASAKAAYLTAKAQADREAPLAAKDYISPQDYESAVTVSTQAKAALQQAEINLSYTSIKSSIDGLTGNLAVKAGNVVTPTATTPLVTINQMQPILVQFTIPQQLLTEVRHYDTGHGIMVYVTNEDGSGNLGQGKLVFIDNTVNNTTGTVMLKAEIPNKHVQLWPGQYVGVTLQLTVQPDAIVIPDTAVQAGQNGSFVYTVVDNKSVIAPVTQDRQIGDEAVISKGLKAGEVVITHVPRTLKNEMPVIPNVARPTSAVAGSQ